MNLNPLHWISIVATISSVAILGLYAGRRVKSSGDFLVAGRTMGPALVSGSILGTILGGSSTVGTAELAFKYGLSAWWWTLGSGLGCLVLGFVVCRYARQERVPTVGTILTRVFGRRAGTVATLVLVVALFISLVPNILSSFAVLSSVSALSRTGLGLVAAGSIAAYVVLGGLWGTSVVGVLKVLLIAFSLIVSSATAWLKVGGLGGVVATLPAYPWLSLFGRGVWLDLGSAIGVTMGIFTNQVYIQALAGARSDGVARAGSLISAAVAPVLGAMGVFVGLSMRVTDPGVVSSQVLPLFVLRSLPPVVAGMALGTFFVAAVGTSAGLALSIGTLLTSDLPGSAQIRLERRSGPREVEGRARLTLVRTLVFTVIAAGVAAACVVRPSFILQWSIISMGIRGTSIGPAFLAAIVFGRKLQPAGGMLSMLAGFLVFACGQMAFHTSDPVLPAFAVSLTCLAVGALIRRVRPAQPGTSSRG